MPRGFLACLSEFSPSIGTYGCCGWCGGAVTLLRNASLDSGYIFCVSLLAVGRPNSYSLTYRAPVSVTGGAVLRRCLDCFCAWIIEHPRAEICGVSAGAVLGSSSHSRRVATTGVFGPASAEYCLEVCRAVFGQVDKTVVWQRQVQFLDKAFDLPVGVL